VVTAKDGVEAISMLQDHRPDVILLDVEMPAWTATSLPGMCGTTRPWRRSDHHGHVPCEREAPGRAIEIGVNDYLGKPVPERELLEAVQHQLARPVSDP